MAFSLVFKTITNELPPQAQRNALSGFVADHLSLLGICAAFSCEVLCGDDPNDGGNEPYFSTDDQVCRDQSFTIRFTVKTNTTLESNRDLQQLTYLINDWLRQHSLDDLFTFHAAEAGFSRQHGQVISLSDRRLTLAKHSDTLPVVAVPIIPT